MPQSIFFSWQADTPNRVGRTFLREVLDEVCAAIAAETAVDEAAREVEVDSDTQGVAGQPPIAETIFRKIDAAAVFVADVSFTGQRIDGRPTPNANVLIEYGWALKALRHERVVCLMNDAYGAPSRENLPFDLAHLRWPITYSLPDGASAEVKKDEKRKLTKTLKAALSACIATVPTPPTVEPPPFTSAEAKDGPARFRSPGDALGFEDDSLGRSNEQVYLAGGPAIWLRLFPGLDSGRVWTTGQIRNQIIVGESGLLMPLVSPAGGYSYLRSGDGMGMYRAPSTDGPKESIEVVGIAFVFRTGEVWSVDTKMMSYDARSLPSAAIERALTEGADRYRRLETALGISSPLRWRAGIVGAKGRRLTYAPQPGHVWLGSSGPICAADLIEAEGVISPEETSHAALLPLFAKIFEECGVERPDYLPR